MRGRCGGVTRRAVVAAVAAVAALAVAAGCSSDGAVEPGNRAAAAPEPEARTFGTSREGRPLVVERRRGSLATTRRLIVVGVTHGDELAGLSVLAALRSAPLPADLEVWLVDTINPDGQAGGTRDNAAGVDLNRNFPAGWEPAGTSSYTSGIFDSGPSPASEPETSALLRLAAEIAASHGPVDGVVWYHQPWHSVGCTPGDVPCEVYAARVGLPVVDEPRPGSGDRWSASVYGARSTAVVELREGSLPRALADRHADALRRYALG